MKNKKIIKKLNILALVLTLSLSGCGNTHNNIEQSESISNEYIIESPNEDNPILNTNKYIVLNEYEDYKQYLTKQKPTYNDLYNAVKNNHNIPQEYKEVFNQVIGLLKSNKVESKNLGIYYENLMKYNINLNYRVTEDSKVAAFFISDPDHPTIYIDPTCVDFYTLLHEIIHSCKELQIRDKDKIILITSQKYEEHNGYIELSGKSFSEAQAEWISRYLYRNNERLFISSNVYNTNNNILELMIDTLDIDINKVFSFNADNFINELIKLDIKEVDANNIINNMDDTLKSKDIDINNLRFSFYKLYIPKLVEYYINQELSTQEIYSKIGNSLKSSIIEDIKDSSEIVYREDFLINQKIIFDYTDEIIKEILTNHNMETSSIYFYIGHEFEIYYSLYNENNNIMSGNYYLAHNWDDIATENCNILLYVEDNTIKICNYAENDDGTLSCYNYFGELNNINNGAKLSDLLKNNIITIEDGYLSFNYPISWIIGSLSYYSCQCSYQQASVSLSNDRYFYINESKEEICNITTNAEGEIIPYHILSNQLYLLPENAINIASIIELYNKEIITLEDNGNINIDNEKLYDYLNNQDIKEYKK